MLFLCYFIIIIPTVKKRKHSITRRDKAESYEGLLLIAGLIARHHVKNRLKEIPISQTKPRQNGDDFLSTNTQENRNVDDTEVQ
jgi:hypothetical protein